MSHEGTIVPHYTAAHWGIREVEGTELRHWSEDPFPSRIGLDQLHPHLQRLRVKRPAVRASWLRETSRGPNARDPQEPFVEVGWDFALDLIAGELERVRGRHGNQAIFGGSYGWSSAGRFHHAQSQLHRFLNVIGGYVRHVDTYSLGAASVMMPHVVMPMSKLMVQQSTWPVIAKHTRLFVSFGGVPLKSTQVSPGGVGKHRASEGMRSLHASGAKLVNIGPVGDTLECEGVEWIPIRPNTDVAVMLALAYVINEEGLHNVAFLRDYCVGFERFRASFTGEDGGAPCTPEWAESVSGMPAARIVTLARELVATRSLINMAWSLQRGSHGEQACHALIALASVVGQIGLPGGGFGFGYGSMNVIGSDGGSLRGPTLPQGRNLVSEFIPVARLSDMLLRPGETFTYNGETLQYPDIRLVYWAGGNPFHHHQDLNRLQKAWQRPEAIIVNEQYWTATARRADVVLPATLPLERDDLGYSAREGHLVAMRKVAAPLGAAKHDYEIFQELAERLGARNQFTEGLSASDWLRRLYGECREANPEAELPEFDDFWGQGMVMLDDDVEPQTLLEAFRRDPIAHSLETPSGRIELYSETVANFRLDDCPGYPSWIPPHEWLGSSSITPEVTFHLLSDQPARRLHSQLDASEYSLGGKIDGREPVDISSVDAQRLGVNTGDVVELWNDRGRCLAATRVTDSIRSGVLRLSTGAWLDLDSDGRDRHGNPNVLTLDVGTSSLAQGCAAHTCLVNLRGPIKNPPEVRAFDLPVLR